uniref:uncharacterized protein LOC132661359 isoform X1 n=3 Tax=Panthera onca TaxID=9690 RepID=UPI00295429AA|nr:uncharacterized protein LOC132661359 isoform X1 [Panthera onca]XP_060461799.1 uncharacterized protein LOC132661359 isoform X1 [Panthera onca]
MALKILNIQDEVFCPICLELLTESLSLDCGHSFCEACITANTKEAEIRPEGENSCPVCGVRYSLENLWPNQHLANIVEKIRKVQLSPEEELKRDLCVRHEEKLLLFCKEDRKIICWLCERSQEHHGHHTFLVEEVVKECQEKLQAALERLKTEQQKVEKLEADIREERTSWKYQIQTERQRIRTEFNQLRSILDSEEQRELQKLEEEEKRILDNLAEAEDDLAQQNQLVKELISDLEHRSEWPTVDLLQDMSGIMKWSEIWTLRKPKTVSRRLKSSFHAPDLRAMLRIHRELTHVQCYWGICEQEEPQKSGQGAAAMASELLKCLQEEVTCPICLDILTQPLSLDCGHSFCQACITAKTKESTTNQAGESRCPVCRIRYCTGELRPNWHVANIVERLREVKVSPEEGQKINLCERHEEKLLLFCKTDGKVICWLCERSQEHRGHHTVLVEEIAQDYQKKLQEALWKLKEDQQETRMLEAGIGEERTSWKKQMQTERQSIQAQFKKLKDILEYEELRELQNLENEEKAVLGSLAEAEDELARHSQLLTDLISDLEHQLQGSTMDMLQDVNHLMERSRVLSLKKPKTFLKGQRNTFRALDLKEIIQAFKKAHVIPH